MKTKLKFPYAIIVLLISALAMYSQASQAQVDRQRGPVLAWEKSKHDLGTITQGDVVEYTFKFTNKGTEPLIIHEVQVSCGCITIKDWPLDPITPGGKGNLVIRYNSSGKIGTQTRTVTIFSNAINDTKIISFTAFVVEKEPR